MLKIQFQYSSFFQNLILKSMLHQLAKLNISLSNVLETMCLHELTNHE